MKEQPECWSPTDGWAAEHGQFEPDSDERFERCSRCEQLRLVLRAEPVLAGWPAARKRGDEGT